MGALMLHAVDVESDPAAIRGAIATKDGLAAFWTADVEAEPKVGSVAVFRFPAAPVPLEMRVEAIDSDRVVWRCEGDFPHWEGTTVTWELRPGSPGTGTEVLFRHQGWGDDYPEIEFARVNWVWGQVVARLKSYCESGRPQPFFPAATVPA
jgi:hypothetical protein